MDVYPVFRSVDDFLKAGSLENYGLSSCQPEPAKGSAANGLRVFCNQEDTNPSPAIPDSVIQKIKDALESISFKDPYVLVQFWAPYQPAGSGSGCLLKTLNQPFGITDLSLELLSYRMASLKEGYYVNLESKQGVGFIGSVFLKGSPEWTTNVPNYSSKEYPQNDGGRLAIPVFEDGGHCCLGVLEIVMTIEKESYDWEFIESCRALQGVNLRSCQVLICPKRGSKLNLKADVVVGLGPKRKPKTKTSGITYEDLSSRFDKSRATAAKELKISKSSLRNICRNFGIDKWPYEKRSRGFGTPSTDEDDGGQSPMEASDYPDVVALIEHTNEDDGDQSPMDAAAAAALLEHSILLPVEDESGAAVVEYPSLVDAFCLPEYATTISTDEYEPQVIDGEIWNITNLIELNHNDLVFSLGEGGIAN